MARGDSASRGRLAASLAAAAALFLLPGGAAHAWSDNYLLNPGFEDGNDHWGAYAYWGNSNPYPGALAVQEYPHSGVYALRIDAAAGGRAQTVAKPRPNTTYRLAAWGKVSIPGNAGWVGVEYYDIHGNRYAPAVQFTSTTYQYLEMQFTTPATIDWMRVFAWKDESTGYLYVDDVSLVGPDLLVSPGSTIYYVDSIHGNDALSGTVPFEPWQTLDKVNTVLFAPGDHILLKAGCSWTGQLDPWGSGEAGSPIVIDSYTDGPKPLIDGQGLVTAPFRLYNQQHWEVSNLELTNYDGTNVRERFGAWVTAEDAGILTHIHVKNLNVHDVNGLLDDAHKGNGGIIFDIRGLSRVTRYDDILISGCRVRAVDRSGIWIWSYWWDRNLSEAEPQHWVGSTNVVVRNNFVEDIGGDGIVPCICSGPLVEYNVAKDCNKRSGRWCVGIWPWACDDAVFQYNEAYLTRTTRDGEGFDSDWFSHNTIIQYNYSHDNEGGFCLICANGTYSGFNDGTVVRYNISQNDQTRSFHIAGPCTNSYVYNNTIYIGEGMNVSPVVHSDWGGYADNTHFYNNIFYNLGTGDYDLSLSTNNVFDYNVFHGNHPPNEPADAHKLTEDPKLADPGAAGIGRDTCDGYKLLPSSPCIDAGLAVPENGGLDYWGNVAPAGTAADIGAHEYRQFLDVETDHWAFVQIGACVDAGLVGGYPDGCYHPEWVVSRDQMAVFVSRALVGGEEAIPDGPQEPTFPDVHTDHWAYDKIEYAAANNIVEGYPNGTYHPEYELGRGQMAVFVARAIVTPTGEAGLESYQPPETPTFDDVPVDYWCYTHVEYLAAEDLVAGYPDGNYYPIRRVSRDQTAVFIARTFELPM
ncbi:MAG: S-layer homology domain-containing protein [Armatimonadota bacterium]|nr:MAG: S-layer homology domain-containing protein [Armatimonadota bacterium]